MNVTIGYQAGKGLTVVYKICTEVIMHASNQEYARKYEKSYPQVSFLNCMHVSTI